MENGLLLSTGRLQLRKVLISLFEDLGLEVKVALPAQITVRSRGRCLLDGAGMMDANRESAVPR